MKGIHEVRDIQQNNFLISEKPDCGKVDLTIFGMIEEPKEYINELTKLRELSNTNQILTIYINSNGGSVRTLISLLSIMKLYDLVITIAEGAAISAAFMLWARGDVRVTSDHTIFMAHRESYGMSGTISKHSNYNKILQKTLGPLFKRCLEGVLTKKELLDAQTIDVFLNDKTLVKRKKCITYQEYLHVIDNIREISLITINDILWYPKLDGTLAQVSSFEIHNDSLTFYDVIKKCLSCQRKNSKKRN